MISKDPKEPEISPLRVEPSFVPSPDPEVAPVPGPKINPNPEKVEPVKILPEVHPDSLKNNGSFGMHGPLKKTVSRIRNLS